MKSNETPDTLSPDAIKNLQALIKVNLDSKNGLEEAAGMVDHVQVKQLLTSLSADRGRQAAELQALLEMNDEQPSETGSILGDVHRLVMNWREAFGGGNVAMLQEAERGETFLMSAYEGTIRSLTANQAVTDLVVQQFLAVKEAAEKVEVLRKVFEREAAR